MPVDVAAGEDVPALAMHPAGAGQRRPDLVDAGRDGLDVSRVAALAPAAQVVELEAVRDRLDEDLVRHPVRGPAAPLDGELAVAAAVLRGGPQPAVRSRV